MTAEEATEIVGRVEVGLEPYGRSTREAAPEEARDARFLIRLLPKDTP